MRMDDPEGASMVATEESSPQPKGFSIYTWNINGLRTLNMTDVIRNLNCDILAVQETKISRDQLTETVAYIDGCSSFFTFSTRRSGYSGVATYCRKECTPVKAEEGLSGLVQALKCDDSIGGHHELSDSEKQFARQTDSEGRAIITQHQVKLPNGELKPLTIINVYCPRLRDEPGDPVNNTELKYIFHTLIGKRGMNLVSNGSFVLIVGDLNVSHKRKDVADGADTLPSSLFREWLDYLLDSRNGKLQFHDTFRALHSTQENAFTCWCSRTNARENNYGSRIDYILADSELMKYLDKAEIHPDIMGSDHCPASAVFHSLVIQNSNKHPPLSTKWYPELKGKQQNLKGFFTRQSAPSFPLKSPASNPLNAIKKTSSFKQTQSKTKQSGVTKSNQMSLAHFIIKKPKQEPAQANPQSIEPDIPALQAPCNGSQCKITDNGQDNGIVKMESETSEPSNSDPASTVECWEVPDTSKTNAAQAWKQLMKAPEVPQCPGHKEPCKLRVTKKKGANFGRKFWSCSRGDGKDTDPNANCGYFQWVVNSK